MHTLWAKLNWLFFISPRPTNRPTWTWPGPTPASPSGRTGRPRWRSRTWQCSGNTEKQNRFFLQPKHLSRFWKFYHLRLFSFSFDWLKNYLSFQRFLPFWENHLQKPLKRFPRSSICSWDLPTFFKKKTTKRIFCALPQVPSRLHRVLPVWRRRLRARGGAGRKHQGKWNPTHIYKTAIMCIWICACRASRSSALGARPRQSSTTTTRSLR